MTRPFTIRAVRAFTLDPGAGRGTYFEPGDTGHWLVDSRIANPMSGYRRYRDRRSSWGIGVLGAIVVEIETEGGAVGVATGSGGHPAAWIVQHHFARFLVGQDARNINLIWDQMYRASLPYGRKGVPVMAISAVDLALWDLVGKIRGEAVVNLIGGRCRDEIDLYCTSPQPAAVRALGFWGAKVPLPHGPHDGEAGLQANLAALADHRAAVGPGYPLMVDCYMALTVPYAIRLAALARPLAIHWWEEVLSPDDSDGYREIRRAHPDLTWATAEHECTRYGFRQLIAERLVDILQPDVMWVGGLTETLRIAAHAAAYDTAVIPHGSGPYSYHFIASQPGPAFCEYVAASADGRSIRPVFGDLFTGEPMPQDGRLTLPDAPGFGMELRDRAMLVPVG